LPDSAPDRLGEDEMTEFLLEYLPIVIFFAIAIAMGAGFLLAPWVLAPKRPDKEKNSAYECGFNAFDDARMKFDIRFYLVSILFIIFDLEIAFLFPWVLALVNGVKADPATYAGPHPEYLFWSMMVFLGVLTIGLVYELRKGALEWE
jgi:NADH-quinone oxidoreductase subunit A